MPEVPAWTILTFDHPADTLKSFLSHIVAPPRTVILRSAVSGAGQSATTLQDGIGVGRGFRILGRGHRRADRRKWNRLLQVHFQYHCVLDVRRRFIRASSRAEPSWGGCRFAGRFVIIAFVVVIGRGLLLDLRGLEHAGGLGLLRSTATRLELFTTACAFTWAGSGM